VGRTRKHFFLKKKQNLVRALPQRAPNTSRLYGWPISEPRQEKENKQFFFEKKEPKNFCY
jgi:hypothetical protein